MYFPAATKTEATGKRGEEMRMPRFPDAGGAGVESTKPTDAFIAFNRLSISVGLQFSVRAEGEKGGEMEGERGFKTGFHRYQSFAR